MQGTVKWFDGQKGYGFIGREGDKDIFVHFSNISSESNQFRGLDAGDLVGFEIEKQTNGKIQAINVELLRKVGN